MNDVLDFRRIVRNALSLYGAQAVRFAVPLITFPYVVRVLEPAGYGRFAFAQSIIGYGIILTNYGFDWSVTRTVARHRDDPGILSRVASSVWLVKGSIALVGAAALFFAVEAIEFGVAAAALVQILSLRLLGQALLPRWVYRGLERMGILASLDTAGRVLEAICIFAFVNELGDEVVYAWIVGSRSVLIGAVGAGLAVAWTKVDLTVPSVDRVKEVVVDGWLMFIASGSENAMEIAPAFLVGLFGDASVVGIYRGAERIVRAAGQALDPVSQALFPAVSKQAKSGEIERNTFFKVILPSFSGLALVVGAALFVLADPIAGVLLGDAYEQSTTVIRWLSLLPVLLAIVKIVGIQTLVPLGHDRWFASGRAIGLVALVAASVVLVEALGTEGMALSVLIGEAVVAAILSARTVPLFFRR